jgi:rhodanese-related sulfurtransferase
MNPISQPDLQALIETGDVTLVEALPAPHYDAGHLPGALNLPGPLTPDLAPAMVPDKTRTVVTYCSGPACARSKIAATAFTRLGYTDVRVYTDGKAGWHAASLPLHTHAPVG